MARNPHRFSKNVEKFQAGPRDRIMFFEAMGLRVTLEKQDEPPAGSDEEFFNVPQLHFRIERFGEDTTILKLTHLSSEEISGLQTFIVDALDVAGVLCLNMDQACEAMMETGAEYVPERVFRSPPGSGSNRALTDRINGLKPEHTEPVEQENPDE